MKLWPILFMLLALILIYNKMPSLFPLAFFGAVLLPSVSWIKKDVARLKKRTTKLDEAAAAIDAALESRYAALSKLAESARPYLSEQELSDLAKPIQPAADSTLDEKSCTADELARMAQLLRTAAEKHPQFAALKQFAQLWEDVTESEDALAHVRDTYNGLVRELNDSIVAFPVSMIASLLRIKPREPFVCEAATRAVPEDEKSPVS